MDFDPIETSERVCEECDQWLLPVSDEPMCRVCVRELFETKPRPAANAMDG
ncbi:MAG TPA: hypothetical protein PKD11_08355 [Pyrinomonadaceae bacterium]|nr:hypothetical protein [Pyrinomonadaceae bacterium]